MRDHSQALPVEAPARLCPRRPQTLTLPLSFAREKRCRQVVSGEILQLLLAVACGPAFRHLLSNSRSALQEAAGSAGSGLPCPERPLPSCVLGRPVSQTPCSGMSLGLLTRGHRACHCCGSHLGPSRHLQAAEDVALAEEGLAASPRACEVVSLCKLVVGPKILQGRLLITPAPALPK